MPTEDTNQSKPATLDDIAAMLVGPTPSQLKRPAKEATDVDGIEDADGKSDGGDLEFDTDAGEDDGEADSDSAGEDDDDVESDGEDDASEDETEDEESDDADLSDSKKVKVKVDGKERIVTIGDLKKNYSGEKAIEGRLQVATSYRDAALKDYDNTKTVFTKAMEVLGKNLFRRAVPPPDESLRTSNPTKYLLDKESYDNETRALLAQHAEMQQAVALADAEAQKAKAERRKTAAAALRQAIPALADPEKGPKLKKQIVDTAAAYGFTQEELAEVEDPRMFVLVRDLARFKAAGATSSPKVEREKPVVRTLAKKAAKRPTTSVERELASATRRARETGKVDDVAMAMLTVAKPTRRAR